MILSIKTFDWSVLFGVSKFSFFFWILKGFHYWSRILLTKLSYCIFTDDLEPDFSEFEVVMFSPIVSVEVYSSVKLRTKTPSVIIAVLSVLMITSELLGM